MLKSSIRARQLILLSGKGGTGKTSLCAAFAHLSSLSEYLIQSVFVDADVDAANLSLALKLDLGSPIIFWGGSLAAINPDLCAGCGDCVPVCRYDAILSDGLNPQVYRINPIACEGCAACVYACPCSAISMIRQHEGNWFQSDTPYGPLLHAELYPGRENSGKLVTLVKQQGRLLAEDTNTPLVIIDGPPGIGCPVISTCAGANLGLIVTEPGQAGLHDLKRIFGTLQHFQITSLICINKADIYPQGTREIKDYALEQNINVLGEIPFDENVPRAMLMGAPITEAFPESPASKSIKTIWGRTLRYLFGQKEL